MQRISFAIKQDKPSYIETMENFECRFFGAAILLRQKFNDNFFKINLSLKEIDEAAVVHFEWSKGNKMITSDLEDNNSCKVTFCPRDPSLDNY